VIDLESSRIYLSAIFIIYSCLSVEIDLDDVSSLFCTLQLHFQSSSTRSFNTFKVQIVKKQRKIFQKSELLQIRPTIGNASNIGNLMPQQRLQLKTCREDSSVLIFVCIKETTLQKNLYRRAFGTTMAH